MAKQKGALSPNYLPGNAFALKLLGCCFIELMEERWKPERPLWQEFAGEFGEKAGWQGSKASWNRWRDARIAKNPFMGNHQDQVARAYEWALGRGLIDSNEKQLFEDLWKLFIHPLELFDSYDSNRFDKAIVSVMTDLGRFELTKRKGQAFYFLPLTGELLDLATLETKRVGRKACNDEPHIRTKSQDAAVALAKVLLQMVTATAFSRPEQVAELSLEFVSLKCGQKKPSDKVFRQLKKGQSKEILADLSLGELHANPFLRDVVLASLVEEGRALVERLVATCGSAEAKTQMDSLKKYCWAAARDYSK